MAQRAFGKFEKVDPSPTSSLQKYIRQPNYAVLIDTRDRHTHKAYIPQEHLEVISQTKVCLSLFFRHVVQT